jgi:hypothetical protein
MKNIRKHRSFPDRKRQFLDSLEKLKKFSPFRLNEMVEFIKSEPHEGPIGILKDCGYNS